MKSHLSAALVGCSIFICSIAAAQQQPAQNDRPFVLDNGIPQSFGLPQTYVDALGYRGLPSDLSVSPVPHANSIQVAIKALNKKDFTKAKSILDKYPLATSDPSVSYLAGMANYGVGNHELARDYFAAALQRNGRLWNAHVALAAVNLLIGDHAAADKVLGNLLEYQAQCNSKCSQASQIDRVKAVVQEIIALKKAA